jgi:hypothetical protein
MKYLIFMFTLMAGAVLGAPLGSLTRTDGVMLSSEAAITNGLQDAQIAALDVVVNTLSSTGAVVALIDEDSRLTEYTSLAAAAAATQSKTGAWTLNVLRPFSEVGGSKLLGTNCVINGNGHLIEILLDSGTGNSGIELDGDGYTLRDVCIKVTCDATYPDEHSYGIIYSETSNTRFDRCHVVQSTLYAQTNGSPKTIVPSYATNCVWIGGSVGHYSPASEENGLLFSYHGAPTNMGTVFYGTKFYRSEHLTGDFVTPTGGIITEYDTFINCKHNLGQMINNAELTTEDYAAVSLSYLDLNDLKGTASIVGLQDYFDSDDVASANIGGGSTPTDIGAMLRADQTGNYEVGNKLRYWSGYERINTSWHYLFDNAFGFWKEKTWCDPRPTANWDWLSHYRMAYIAAIDSGARTSCLIHPFEPGDSTPSDRFNISWKGYSNGGTADKQIGGYIQWWPSGGGGTVVWGNDSVETTDTTNGLYKITLSATNTVADGDVIKLDGSNYYIYVCDGAQTGAVINVRDVMSLRAATPPSAGTGGNILHEDGTSTALTGTYQSENITIGNGEIGFYLASDGLHVMMRGWTGIFEIESWYRNIK